MIIPLGHTLEKNTAYINHGTNLSRFMLLQNNFSDAAHCIISSSERQISSLQKIASFFKSPYYKMSSISDLIDLKNKENIFRVSQPEVFFLKIQDFSSKEYAIKKGKNLDLETFKKWLHDNNYNHAEYIESHSFNIAGDTIHISNPSNTIHYSINLWGEEIEEIIATDQVSGEILNKEVLYIGSNQLLELENIGDNINPQILDLFMSSQLIFDNLDLHPKYDLLLNADYHAIIFCGFINNTLSQKNLGVEELHIKDLDIFKEKITNKTYKQKIIVSKNTKGVQNFLDYNDITGVKIISSPLNNLKSFSDNENLVICDDNISRIFIKKRMKKSMSKNLDLLMQIKPGDYIVHRDHGIGVFNEIITKDLGGVKNEYIEIEYKGNDKLFVPINEVNRVNKYVGDENPKLTGLGTNAWEKKLKKVSEDVEEIAGELLEIYAKRKLQKGFAFKKYDEEEVFKRSFEYVYTEDQLNIIEEIATDMESSTPMDRLLSGDVGFGKTEIAFNTLYKAILNKKQGVLISPLVVLAYEHYEKAKERFKDFGVIVEVLTRFEKPKVITATLERLKTGKIDLIIGTHRLLSEDIQFKDLGVLVIDEEHKFGVKDKEKIKKIRERSNSGNTGVDILSMSATPIPRSLNMALNGIKSVSMLTTPPTGRQSVETTVCQFDDNLIIAAGKREFERGGQLFFIHNRVQTIDSFAIYLQKLFPGKKIAITHGQLSGDQLETRIIEFKRKQYDILLSTTVIENGIDFPNANTIIINEANKFGISNIHQLRGRVGRSDTKGYCYLLFQRDKIKEDAAKRLQTIVQYSHLGAGFELAIKDLEIRGGGDILGIRQSGQSKEIGVNLFLEMLENKIEELKNKSHSETRRTTIQSSVSKIETSIDLQVGAYIEDSLFNSELDKINFYREIESIDSLSDLDDIIDDFLALRSEVSQETKNFFSMLRLKLQANSFKIISIKKVGINYQIDFIPEVRLDDVKRFLQLDSQVKFAVSSISRLRSPIKSFENSQFFLQYLLQLFNKKIGNKKIKLKRKA